MGLLQPYRGTYYSAESANTKLDINSILAGCNAVDEEANHISEYANDISESGSYLDANALSVDGKTMQGSIETCCTNINDVESFIIGTTAQIREMAEAAYNQIQDNLNYEAQQRDIAEYNRRRRAN